MTGVKGDRGSQLPGGAGGQERADIPADGGTLRGSSPYPLARPSPAGRQGRAPGEWPLHFVSRCSHRRKNLKLHLFVFTLHTNLGCER